MSSRPSEDELLRAVALQNAQAILAARQRAEDELARSLSLMRATLEATSDGILAVDVDRRITHYNGHFLALWGLDAAATENADTLALAATVAGRLQRPEAFVARIREIYEASPAESYDVLEFADGRIVERFSRVQVLEGRNAGRVWTFRDVTERRRAEDALREETRTLELLNRAGVALAANLERDKVVQTLIDAATELVGAHFGAFFYNVTDAAGARYQLYVLSGARREDFEGFGQPRNTPLFAPTFAGETIVRSDDVTRDPRYGRVAPHHGMPRGHLPVKSYLAVPVRSRGGEVLGGLFFGHPQAGRFDARDEELIAGLASHAAVAIDNAHLYERERAARAEAERMGALKDEFLATLSHELRTPLGAILGWTQVLRRRHPASTTELDEALGIIERNARAQTQLIEDLLDMSRITSGKVRLDMRTLDPAGFVEAALETVRPAAEAKSIGFVRRFEPDAGPVAGDAQRLQQVVCNLLSNAIKFTPGGGKVRVTLERADGQLELRVADTGIGIQPHFMAHLFERFRQADASTTRHHGGLGLGLSIVKSLVELHGGTVHAQSDGEGRGATFTVRLPLASSAPDTAIRHIGAGFTPADLSGLTLLVVDDQPDAVQLLARQLGECGARVLAALSAAEALALAAHECPDLLITDIGMPEADGYELLRRVRALEGPAASLRAVALTAFARSEDRTRALHAGFSAHLSKPVDPSELVATVASLAGRTP